MTTSSLQATALISLDNLQNNLMVVKKIAPKSKQLVVVKANLYGHRITPVLQTIDQCLNPLDILGVTHIDQAIAIRNNGCSRRLLLLHGITNVTEIQNCYQNNIEIVIHHPCQIEHIQQQKKKKPSKTPIVWIKIDTGMNRLGLTPSQIKSHFSSIKRLMPHAILTHLSQSDFPQSPQNNEQIKHFSSSKKLFDFIPYQSIANSGALLNQLVSFGKKDYVRPGIMIYGFSPNPVDKHNDRDKMLKPIVSVIAPLISVKAIKKGALVGYGGTWKCPQNGTLATLKIGYADGYPRCLGNQSSVFLKGRFFPVVGRVSMDLITIYLDHTQPNNPTLHVGDFAEIWGGNVCLYNLAKKAQTIPYELLTGLADRVARKIDKEEGFLMH